MNLEVPFGVAMAGLCILSLGCNGDDTDGRPSHLQEKTELNAVEAINTLLSVEDWEVIIRLPENWNKELSSTERKGLCILLTERLDSPTPIKLTNDADLFVPTRGRAGKMAFHGHGLLIDQDVFLEGGRCAWALESLLGLTLPTIEEGLSKADLDRRKDSARSLVTAAIR